MSVYAEWEGGGDQVASTTGWSDFGAWADQLDAELFPEVVRLWEYGGVDSATDLVSQLESALRDDSPADWTVRHTADGLLALARKAAGSGESFDVTDGMGRDDGRDEADDEADAAIPPRE